MNIAVDLDNPQEAGADRLVNADCRHIKKYRGDLLDY